MKVCGEMKLAFEQSICVVYLPLFVLVTFSKPHNIFNTMEEFVQVCILGIPLKITNFYDTNFKIQSTCFFFLYGHFLFAQKCICLISHFWWNVFKVIQKTYSM